MRAQATVRLLYHVAHARGDIQRPCHVPHGLCQPRAGAVAGQQRCRRLLPVRTHLRQPRPRFVRLRVSCPGRTSAQQPDLTRTIMSTHHLFSTEPSHLHSGARRRSVQNSGGVLQALLRPHRRLHTRPRRLADSLAAMYGVLMRRDGQGRGGGAQAGERWRARGACACQCRFQIKRSYGPPCVTSLLNVPTALSLGWFVMLPWSVV